MKFNVSSVNMNVNVTRNIYVNDDISLVVQNTVFLYQSGYNTFSHEVDDIDLVSIYVKGKQFKYEEFNEIKQSIKLIYDIDIDVVVENHEYTEEHSYELGEYMCVKYQDVLKIN